MKREHNSSEFATEEFDGHTYHLPRVNRTPNTILKCICCEPGSQSKALLWIDGELLPYSENELVDYPLWDEEQGNLHMPDNVLRLQPGESVKVRFLEWPENPGERRVGRHWWHGGASITCPEYTAPAFIAEQDRGRKCPLCALGDALADRLRRRLDYYFPVLDLSRSSPTPRLLKLNQTMFGQWREALRRDIESVKVLWTAGRESDGYGKYFLEPTREAAKPLAHEYPVPRLRQPSIRGERELAAFAETISIAGDLEPRPGRVEKWRARVHGASLIACVWGTKWPLRSGYMNDGLVEEWMHDEHYLAQLDESGIALKLDAPYACIDPDCDEDVAEFVRLNPWAAKTLTVYGARGCKFFFKLKGEYPKQILNAFKNGDHAGEFRGSGLAMLDGLHPSGKLYRVENADNLVEIVFNAIVWPNGWRVEKPHSERKFETGDGETVEGGLLDERKLNNVRQHQTKDGAITAQCPACAKAGGDQSGNHLIVFGDGRFGCVKHQGDEEHRSEIFALVKRDDLKRQRKSKDRGDDDDDGGSSVIAFCVDALEQKIDPVQCVAKDWHAYKDGIWASTDYNIYRPLALQMLPARKQSDKRAREILNTLEARRQVTRESLRSFACFDQDGAVLLCCRNGVLRVDKGAAYEDAVTLLPHDEAYGFTLKLAAAYNPKAECRLFCDIEVEALPDERDRDLLEAFGGYTLLPSCNLQVALFGYGGGGTGKTTLWEGIASALGQDLTMTVPLASICSGNGYSVPRLQHAALNLGMEAPAGDLSESAAFKLLVEGAPMEARGIYGVPFTMRDYHVKLVFLGNHLPRFKSGTDAELRRCRFLHFQHKHSQVDPGIAARVKRERDGIFSTIMVPWLKCLLRGSVMPEGGEASTKVAARFTLENDPIKAFIDDCCELGRQLNEDKKTLRRAFEAFVERNDLNAGLVESFFKRFRQRFPGITSYRPRKGNDRPWRFLGIQLKADVELAPVRRNYLLEDLEA